MAMRREEQRLFVPVRLTFAFRLVLRFVGKPPVSTPPVHGPAVIQQAFMLFVIPGQNNPVTLPVTPCKAPLADLVGNGRTFAMVDIRIAVARLRVIWRVQEHPAGSPTVLPVATTYPLPVSADYPDSSQTLAELPEPLIETGRIGIPDIQELVGFCGQGDFMDAMGAFRAEARAATKPRSMIQERDLVIDPFTIGEVGNLPGLMDSGALYTYLWAWTGCSGELINALTIVSDMWPLPCRFSISPELVNADFSIYPGH